MNYNGIITIALTALVSIKVVTNNSINLRVKRANGDRRFNVLLKLYKMNPLKQSKIFKSFSDRVLLSNRDDLLQNFNAAESIERKDRIHNEMTNNYIDLKLMEDTLHITHPPSNTEIAQPSYKIANRPETFENNFKLNEATRQEFTGEKSKLLKPILTERTESDLQVTQMLPVNITKLKPNNVINENDDDLDLNNLFNSSYNFIEDNELYSYLPDASVVVFR